MKTEMKHTKGKWTQDSYIIASEETHEEIAWALALSAGASRNAESMANAKLIAAAPELLEALTYLVEKVSPIIYKLGVKKGFSELVALTQATKAIHKATE